MKNLYTISGSNCYLEMEAIGEVEQLFECWFVYHHALYYIDILGGAVEVYILGSGSGIEGGYAVFVTGYDAVYLIFAGVKSTVIGKDGYAQWRCSHECLRAGKGAAIAVGNKYQFIALRVI